MLPWINCARGLEILASLRQPRATPSAQIACVQNTTSTLEDAVQCFDAYTVSEGYYTDETYAAAQPTADQLEGWEDLVSALLSVDGNCTSLVVPPAIADIYDVSLFTDAATGAQYCVGSETTSVDGLYSKGWGLFVVPATQKAVLRDIHLAAPHPAYDLFTPEQAGALFKSTGARSLLISGRIRTANLAPSDCVIPSSNTTVYYKTDPTHDTVGASVLLSLCATLNRVERTNGWSLGRALLLGEQNYPRVAARQGRVSRAVMRFHSDARQGCELMPDRHDVSVQRNRSKQRFDSLVHRRRRPPHKKTQNPPHGGVPRMDRVAAVG